MWGSFKGAFALSAGYVPPLEVLDARHALLRVGHHLAEEVGKARAAELGRPRAVEVAVVDGLAVGGGAETRRG